MGQHVALEQFADVNPWEGLRFGALNPASDGEFRGILWQGHTYNVRIGPNKTALDRDGTVRFEADAGVVVREYQVEPARLSFRLTSERPVHLRTREFEAGTFQVAIDGKAVSPVAIRQGIGKVSVPAGEHVVALLQ